MQSVAERLAKLPTDQRRDAIARLTDEEAEALLYEWRGFLARPDQIEPPGDWEIWAVLAGRGFGKTETGAQWVKERAEDKNEVIALVGETAADVGNVMVKRLLSIYPEGEKPEWIGSRRMINFRSGAVAFTYNGTEPDQLRGPEHSSSWVDELAKYRYARETWDQLQFGLRIGAKPRVLVTTTPRPIELIKSIIAGKEGLVHVTRGKTNDNRANLAASFLKKIEKRYAGTRLGRQELDAEILGDLPGALWSMASLDAYRLPSAPPLGRIVVSVDPAVTATEESDEHGIIVAAMTADGRGVVLEDASMQGTPAEWARRAVSLSRSWGADGVVVEVNQGGDMVAHTLRTVDPNLNIIEVRASRGKHIRAEPIAALYEQGKVAHVGSYPELENQMTQMTQHGYQGDGSPDRLDALVWAFSDLFPDMVDRPPAIVPYKPMRRGWMA